MWYELAVDHCSVLLQRVLANIWGPIKAGKTRIVSIVVLTLCIREYHLLHTSWENIFGSFLSFFHCVQHRRATKYESGFTGLLKISEYYLNLSTLIYMECLTPLTPPGLKPHQ